MKQFSLFVSLGVILLSACKETDNKTDNDSDLQVGEPRTFINVNSTGDRQPRYDITWQSVEAAGVEVHTFQQTVNDSSITRRYLLNLMSHLPSK